MADTTSSAGFKFNLKNPGAKEYAIVGIAALLLGYWYYKKHAAAAAAAQPSTSSGTPATTVVTAPSGGNGMGLASFLAWLQNQNSSPTTTSNGSSQATTTIALGKWKQGLPESQQAWNADLNNIAAHYGISVQQLEQMNPQISNPNSIAPGTLITVPAGTP